MEQSKEFKTQNSQFTIQKDDIKTATPNHLTQLTRQFICKYKHQSYFAQQNFRRDGNQLFHDIQNNLSRYSVELTQHHFFRNMSKTISQLVDSMFSIFTFTNTKWAQQYKKILPEKDTQISPPCELLCRRCRDDTRHKQIKQTKHQIYNLVLEDPHYYYQQVPINPDLFKEESSHKKLQAKLNDLAAGAQMEQRYMKEILSQIEQREKDMKNRQHQNQRYQQKKQEYKLPVMPMLFSVYKHTKNNNNSKKYIKNQSSQTDQIVQYSKNFMPVVQGQNFTSTQTVSLALQSELRQKMQKIKMLEQRLSQEQTIKSQMKAKNNQLISQNVQLMKGNSNMQAIIKKNKRKSRENSKIIKTNAQNTIQRKNETAKQNKTTVLKQNAEVGQKSIKQQQKNRLQRGSVKKRITKISKTQNPTSFLKQNLQYALKDDVGWENEIKSPLQAVFPSSLATAIQSINEQEEETYRNYTSQDVILPNLSKKLLHKSSLKLTKDDPLNASLTQISSATPLAASIPTLPLVIAENQGTELDFVKQTSDRQRSRPRKIFRNNMSRDSVLSSALRSQNQSTEQRFSKIYQLQGKQLLLKKLWNQQIKDKQQIKITFEEFKEHYDQYILGVVGVAQKVEKRQSKQISPQTTSIVSKKSSAYIRKNVRQQAKNNKKNQENGSFDILDQKEKQKTIKKQQLKSAVNDLLVSVPVLCRQQPKKVVLLKQQMHLVTQISAYLMQLKIKNNNAYILVKNMIVSQSENIYGEPIRELRKNIGLIINNHRGCQKSGTAYCSHLQQFVDKIVALMLPIC